MAVTDQIDLHTCGDIDYIISRKSEGERGDYFSIMFVNKATNTVVGTLQITESQFEKLLREISKSN